MHVAYTHIAWVCCFCGCSFLIRKTRWFCLNIKALDDNRDTKTW